MMSSQRYVRLTKGLSDKGKLVSPDHVLDHVDNPDLDHYSSVFYYNQEQFNNFQKTGTVKGIEDVTTNRLVFDFDSKDLDEARHDALQVISRLKKYNIKESDIEIYFSGNKGFGISVTLDKEVTPEELRKIAVKKLGFDLKTLDTTLYNASRILRLPGTKHQDSKLYKIPLTLEELNSLTKEEIKSKAKSLDNIKEDFSWSSATPTPELYAVNEEKKSTTAYALDLSQRPPNWSTCKYSLLQGNFKSGERHQALMVVAATCRGLKYDKNTTYYMCKAALKNQAALSKSEEFPKEELWNNIIEQSVFADGWEGGQYTCKKEGWLKDYCTALGQHSCQNDRDNEPSIIRITDMGSHFENYAQNFEKNVVKTGIGEIDENLILCAGTLNGLLGQPGAGKTSFALQHLLYASKENINSTFASLDMSRPIVYAKAVQKLTGASFKEVLNIFKNDKALAMKLVGKLNEQYKNVGFNFKSGLTPADLRKCVQEQEQQTGSKVRLLVVDYLERLAGPYADPTANGGLICNQLTDLANELEVCIMLLLQTQKHSTPDVSDPLLSLKGVKGSSVIEQSCSTILTLWREGYSPKTVDDDRYISFAVVKNRFGALWSGDLGWDGVRGGIQSLTEEEHAQLEDFRERKKQAKIDEMKNSGWD